MVEPHLIINLLVPTQAVGLLIGKNGSAFRNINQATGININFQSTEDIPDQNFQRVLCLRGENHTAVLTALSMVIEKLQQPRSVPGQAGQGYEEEEACSVRQI
jgi:predicted PilT family ATPase